MLDFGIRLARIGRKCFLVARLTIALPVLFTIAYDFRDFLRSFPFSENYFGQSLPYFSPYVQVGDAGHPLDGEQTCSVCQSFEPSVESRQVVPSGHRESFRWTV